MSQTRRVYIRTAMAPFYELFIHVPGYMQFNIIYWADKLEEIEKDFGIELCIWKRLLERVAAIKHFTGTIL